MTTIIYGSSDDLIEVEGEFYDEFDRGGSDKTDILVGVGSYQLHATIQLGEEWTIKVYPNGIEFDYFLYPAGSEQAVDTCGNDYSDVLIINDPVEFVVIGLVANRN
jgi:hypothetical protein